MIIGRLIKPCKICLFEQQEDDGKIESFSLLKLNLIEAINLFNKGSEIEYTLDNSIVIKYSGNDSVHQYWKELAIAHRASNPTDFIDVSKSFKSTTPGTSVLIRDPIKQIIRIAKRNGDDTNTINRICIDDKDRENFFYDSKKSKYFLTNKKYAIDKEDSKLYKNWAIKMNNTYLYELNNQISPRV